MVFMAAGEFRSAKQIEHANGCGIDDQHAARDNSTMVVAESIIHEWHPTSA